MRLLRYEPKIPNFGDDLNATLWSTLMPGLFAESPRPTAAEEGFVGIGTIIGIDPGDCRRLHVFSSGAGYTSARRWKDREVQFHCVRGPLTARILGLADDRVLTDGAVLCPRIGRFSESPRAPADTAAAVIPHYETIAFPGWAEAVRLAGFNLVDPREAPEVVISAIRRSRLVLTESLHGAILADAFGIPWRGMAVSGNFSTIKWADWAGSLALKIDIAIVPPPDPLVLFRYGRRPEPFGASLALDPELSLDEFRHRITTQRETSRLKSQAKRLLEALPPARRLLGYNAERTAAALVDLAAQEPFLSAQGKRTALQDEMLSRLDGLARQHGAELTGLL
ncbi:polysaccharide pyruvyl transferase family protein [Novosphingobium soli]|uniref:Polysaccharide pyruvyl transferase family protein n=1 Tax=Novosphingobium soli TaxID=574956 RepID=A0ABV6CPZ7_9SPHN